MTIPSSSNEWQAKCGTLHRSRPSVFSRGGVSKRFGCLSKRSSFADLRLQRKLGTSVNEVSRAHRDNSEFQEAISKLRGAANFEDVLANGFLDETTGVRHDTIRFSLTPPLVRDNY
ncbi:hypothetical protein K493DRAFT_299720 [Basidiobolus meristosporus CBS 931.73]|uniref:Uncharacterized protein n=1 Tax=Basidiobolus meristosporus CBS 931.73 TaxID=1314790 RepID=A0A1Y1YLZ7_9FUNG|nr:hypothetical protein K493DRAFT_299720 [Basidiobolus meristosporus CBS 931.73]|eukprot:ORX98863.1 hypothetical protein K493DRAFT_299720 [Basidiobolus meristosporus CBS 931.73]